MRPPGPKLRRVSVLVALLALLPGLASLARAGDIVVFASWPTPTNEWGTGFGAAYSQTLIPLVGFEFEIGQQSGALTDESMTTFSASALLVPPIGPLTPYGGLGFGFLKQDGQRAERHRDLPRPDPWSEAEAGRHPRAARGTGGRIALSGEPLIDVDYRVSIGAGLSF